MNKNIIISIVLIIVVGAGAFFAGMQYQKTKTRSGLGQFAGKMMGGNGQGFARRFGGQNGAAIRGEITSASDTSITVTQRDGSSKIILLAGSTNISKAASGSKADLTKGAQVMAVGTTNSDGSVTAQLIQLNPIMQGGTRSATPTQ